MLAQRLETLNIQTGLVLLQHLEATTAGGPPQPPGAPPRICRLVPLFTLGPGDMQTPNAGHSVSRQQLGRQLRIQGLGFRI